MSAASIGHRGPVTGLYVPGSRPDRFAKALGTGAQLLILDLEDAVAPEAKDDARDAVVRWLGELLAGRDELPVIQVRVNGVGTPWHERDLAALAALPSAVELRLPKVETATVLDAVAAAVGPRPITTILETARGVEAASEIARHDAVTRLALGESDLRSDLGTAPGPDGEAALTHARVRLLYAARAAGLDAPMLAAYPAIRDLDGLRADTARGRDLGASGRVAIHPSQLAVIVAVFAPHEDEVVWARDVVAALTASGGAVTRLPDGAMVDPAMLGRAERILARAEAAGGTSRSAPPPRAI